MKKPKLIRITTVPVSMNIILKGQLAFMNQFYEVIGVSSWHPKHFPEVAKREGIEMIQLEMARGISLWKDIKALLRLYILFRKEKPIIVHTQTPKAGFVGMLASWMAGVPIRLHTVGGLPLLGVSGFKRRLLLMLERITYRCAIRVYPNSNGLKAILQAENLASSKKMKVLGNGGSNGVNTSFFDPNEVKNGTRLQMRMQLGIPEDAFTFLFVGRLAEEKGFKELIEAFELLQNDTGESKIRLLLIGTFEEDHGVLDKNLKERIIKNDNIIKPGRFDDVRPFYLLSDVYVFPSYREGFPNTLLEAGAMGLPIIATDINGCNEIVTHEQTGILIPMKNTMALYKAMAELMVNDTKRNQLVIESRKTIIKKFSQEILWKELLKEYSEFSSKI